MIVRRKVLLASFLGVAALVAVLSVLGYMDRGTTEVSSLAEKATPQGGGIHETLAEVSPKDASPTVHESAAGSADQRNPDIPLSTEAASSERKRVPALPGVEGYDLPLDSTGGQFAAALAAETMDPVWAPEMERLINELLQDEEDLRGVQVEMVCRDTNCGLLFVYSGGDDVAGLKERVKEFRNLVASELGFAGHGTMSMQLADGRTYTQVRLSGASGRQQGLTAFSSPPLLPERFRDRVPTPPTGATIGAIPTLTGDQADHSPSSSTLEFDLRREVLAIVGEASTKLQVECQSSTCIVLLGFAPGASPDPSKISTQIANAAGLTYGSVEKQSSADGDFLTVILNR